MDRNVYKNGNEFVFSDWNKFANSLNNANSLAWGITGGASTAQKSVDVKTENDVIGNGLTQMKDVQAQIDEQTSSTPYTPIIIDDTTANVDFEDINNWLDGASSSGRNVLYLEEQDRLNNGTVANINYIGFETSTTLTKDEANSGYIDGEEIRGNDFGYTFITTSTNFRKINKTTGVDEINITFPINTINVDTSFETSYDWNSRNVAGGGTFMLYDSNYLYEVKIYHIYFIFERVVGSGMNIHTKHYVSSLIRKIDYNGNEISTTQYNHYLSDLNDSDSTSINVNSSNFGISGVVQENNNNIAYVLGYQDYSKDSNESKAYYTYFIGGIISFNGSITSNIRNFSNSCGDAEHYFQYGDGVKIVYNGSYSVGMVYKLMKYHYDNGEQGFYYSSGYVFDGSSITKYNNDHSTSTGEEVNIHGNGILANVDNYNGYVYSYLSFDYRDSSHNIIYQNYLSRITPTGFENIYSYNNEENRVSVTIYGFKQIINYSTNKYEIIFVKEHANYGGTPPPTYEYFLYDGSTVASITEEKYNYLYNTIIGANPHYFDSKYNEGVANFGKVYTYTSPENIITMYNTGYLAEYQNIDFSTNGDNIVRLKQTLPSSRQVSYIKE